MTHIHKCDEKSCKLNLPVSNQILYFGLNQNYKVIFFEPLLTPTKEYGVNVKQRTAKFCHFIVL